MIGATDCFSDAKYPKILAHHSATDGSNWTGFYTITASDEAIFVGGVASSEDLTYVAS